MLSQSVIPIKRKARREKWWRYGERASGLYDAIEGLDPVIVISAASARPSSLSLFPPAKYSMHKVVVFATDDTRDAGFAIQRPALLVGDRPKLSTMEAQVNYLYAYAMF